MSNMVNFHARRPTGRKNPRGARFQQLLSSDKPDDIIALTKQGVDATVIKNLAGCLDVRIQDIGRVIGLSRATALRKIAAGGRLLLAESDRAVRYIRLWRAAKDLWESETAAKEWMTTPARALGGETPFDHAATEIGARRVEQLLGQIEYGVIT